MVISPGLIFEFLRYFITPFNLYACIAFRLLSILLNIKLRHFSCRQKRKDGFLENEGKPSLLSHLKSYYHLLRKGSIKSLFLHRVYQCMIGRSVRNFSYFGPRVYPKGSLVIALVRVFVCVSVFKYLRDCSLFFSSFLHEVRAP